jgi:hypothetical protein
METTTTFRYGKPRIINETSFEEQERELICMVYVCVSDQRVPGYIEGYVRRFWQVCELYVLVVCSFGWMAK